MDKLDLPDESSMLFGTIFSISSKKFIDYKIFNAR